MEANRLAWNLATRVHQKNRRVNLKQMFTRPDYVSLDAIAQTELRNIGLRGKKVAQTSCNNGREAISLVRLGAIEAVGFDIADEAVREAEELADIAKANCRFIRTNVLDIGSEWDAQFDLVYISIGALCWLPDLRGFFAVVSRLLNPGGHLAIYEEHPYMYCLATPDEREFDASNPLKPVHSYFRKEPWIEESGIERIIGSALHRSISLFSGPSTLMQRHCSFRVRSPGTRCGRPRRRWS